MEKLKLQIGAEELASDAQMILKKLIQFNESTVGRSNIKEITVTLKNSEGELIAGLNGFTHWNWFFIKLLWTHESHRGQGLARQLMKAAEKEATQRGAEGAWVDTFSLKTAKFYEQLGYAIFGELSDYPRGHKRIFLQKKLN